MGPRRVTGVAAMAAGLLLLPAGVALALGGLVLVTGMQASRRADAEAPASTVPAPREPSIT